MNITKIIFRSEDLKESSEVPYTPQKLHLIESDPRLHTQYRDMHYEGFPGEVWVYAYIKSDQFYERERIRAEKALKRRIYGK